MPLYTYTQPSKSLADRIYTAEFDDAVIEQQFWKNPRYDGCKITSKEINKFTLRQTASNVETGIGFASIQMQGPTLGSMVVGGNGYAALTVGGYHSAPNSSPQPQLNIPGTFKVSNFIPNITWPGDTINPTGLNANVKNETTAIYISNTVIGGEEDPQFTTIKNHTYINVNQILLIDPITDEVQLLDKQAEDFTPFHSFITNDLPTKSSFSIRLIDESISHNLKGPNQYKVKMNKGFLLKTFNFNTDFGSEQLTENSSMYLYKKGTKTKNLYIDGLTPTITNPFGFSTSSINDDRIRFRYGTIEMINGIFNGIGHTFAKDRIGPSFGSASILSNKFTQQYYSGSFGFINEPTQPQGTTNTDILTTSGLGSASRFIGLNTLEFLKNNNNSALSQQEKTELHITFFQGTKDFSSGANDERSISTFEVDSNQTQLEVGGVCNGFLPKTHEIILKGLNDDRFIPKIGTYEDDFINAYLTSSATAGGCVNQGSFTPSIAVTTIQLGLNADKTTNAQVFIQGGLSSSNDSQTGFKSYNSSSLSQISNFSDPSGPLFGSVSSSDNFYSSSFGYQLSFLDKDHTLITNLDKSSELFDGIGTKGVVLIPEFTNNKIKNNIKHYLELAGIIDSSPNAEVLLPESVN